MITIEQCQCGYKNCRDYWLVGIGKFCQSSGFDKEDAQRIADLLNAADGRAEYVATMSESDEEECR